LSDPAAPDRALQPCGGEAARPPWLRLLVLQPSPFCNINCDYCYLPSRSESHRMEMSTLERIVDAVFASDIIQDGLTIVWHAGEPLAVPLRWYQEAFERIRARAPEGMRVHHSFQTNATLINQAWCDFFKAQDVSVGLSIDGPAAIHDAHRKTRGGGGTHAAAMRGARLLQENGIPFHIISVISAASLGRANEVFDFYVENGFWNVGFNVEETEGEHAASTLGACECAPGVREFLSVIFERHRAHRERMVIREFDFALERIRCGAPPDEEAFLYFNEQVRPFGILSVDWQGGFSTYSPELLGMKSATYGDFTFGSIHDGSFLEAVQSAKFRRVLEDIRAGVEACRRECAYFEMCGGGAPANKYYENGSFCSTETMFCRYTVKLPIDLVLADLEHALRGSLKSREGSRGKQKGWMPDT
jgi:uncharacterized protein